jgi:hypothetical protein
MPCPVPVPEFQNPTEKNQRSNKTMKSILRKLTLCALLGASTSVHAAEDLMPNGDFETPGGANWTENGPITGFSYPTTGGNPGGYGVMDATNGEWGIWVRQL